MKCYCVQNFLYGGLLGICPYPGMNDGPLLVGSVHQYGVACLRGSSSKTSQSVMSAEVFGGGVKGRSSGE